MTSPSKTPKRVRFNVDANTTREFAPEEHEAEGSAPKRQRPDPMQALESEIMGVCLAESSGAGGGMDAAACAASRRAARRRHLMAGFEDDSASGAGSWADIESAEADYEDPEEMFNDAGVPIEPFHLKRERAEGYFDEDGNYVEYKTDDVEDAWADELANVEVDEEWLARVMAGPSKQAGEEPELGPDEVASYKRRLVDLLLPGETVLQALRRLAAVRQSVSHGGGAAAAASSSPGAGGAQPSPAAAAQGPLAQQPRMPSTQVMPPGVREKFEQLTGLSSTLMDQGVYGVHSMSREQLERSILREELAGQQAQQAQQEGQQQQGQQQAEGAAAAAAGTPAEAATAAAAGGGSGDAGQRLAERLLAQASAAAAMPAPSGGPNGSAAAAGEEPVVAAAPAVDAETDIFGQEGDEEPLAQDMIGNAAAAAAAEPAPAPPPAGPQQHEHLPAGSPAADTGSGSQQRTQQEAAPEAAAQAAGEAGMRRDASGDVAMPDCQQQLGIGASAAAAAAAAAAGSSSGEPPELDGFTQDPSSGLWYNSQMGCYYDSSRQLWGDASSGLWFAFDAGTGGWSPAPS